VKNRLTEKLEGWMAGKLMLCYKQNMEVENLLKT
jgi:hypothetical protein